tara:strand:- start:14 stop:256 length:243 start_codon:yes stop_codon:yes gene_type:complete
MSYEKLLRLFRALFQEMAMLHKNINRISADRVDISLNNEPPVLLLICQHRMQYNKTRTALYKLNKYFIRMFRTKNLIIPI